MARAWFEDLPSGTTNEMLRPEDDTQELWELCGRAEALHGLIRRKHRMELKAIDLGEVEAVMGWEECCRKCGHPSEERE